MDSLDSEALWRELTALRARVESLESRLDPERKLPARPAEAKARPGVSFVPPARPSLESRIGSQLFNRVGIVALLVGVAWFLKYAVDQQWLGNAARVFIGFFAGFALIGWSERFRRRGYPVFSFSLKAAGAGILYLSLWASFSLFHLVSYPVAFAGMALVTAGNIWMCSAQRSEALAAVAMVGGFLTPALLGQETSVWTLGSYLVLLNAGLLLLVWRREWPRLMPGAFVGTQAYLLWMAVRKPELLAQKELPAALMLAALFSAAFSLVPVLVGKATPAIAAVVTVADAILGAGELWRLLPAAAGQQRWLPVAVAGWFALLLAARRAKSAGHLPPVHAGLVIGFVAVGVWSLSSGGGVAAGWALEAAVLLWMSMRARGPDVDRVMGSPAPAAALLAMSAASLVWTSLFGALRAQSIMLWNERCGLFLLVVLAAVMAVRVAARQHRTPVQENASLAGQWRTMGAASALLASSSVLFAGVLEIHDYWRGSVGTAERFWDSAWAAMLGVGLLGLGFAVRWAWLRWQGLGLLCLAVGKVVLVDTRALSQGFRIVSFLGLGMVLLLVSFIYQRDLLHLRGKEHEG